MSKFCKSVVALIVLLSLSLTAFAIPIQAASGQRATEIWDGFSAEEPAKGNGTKTNPYEISNGAQLYYVITSCGGDNKYYKITKALD